MPLCGATFDEIVGSVALFQRTSVLVRQKA